MPQNQELDIVSTKAQAEAWAAELETMFALIQQRFPRDEPRQHALAYLKGLLSPIERKNGWQLAEAAGDSTPYAIQPSYPYRKHEVVHLKLNLEQQKAIQFLWRTRQPPNCWIY